MLVVDASVLVKLAAAEPDSDLAIDTLADRDDCIGPDLLVTELASALAKKVRLAGLPLGLALLGFERALPFISQVFESKPLLRQAMSLSDELGHPLFDCTYLALALVQTCPLLTADIKFADRAIAAGYAANVTTLR